MTRFNSSTFSTLSSLALASTLVLGACGTDGGDGPGNEEEVITTVSLTFQPAAGPALVFEFDDADGDGGNAPTIDAVALTAGTYDLSIGFENRLETPAEDITEEIDDEADEHQVFFTGSAVDGPAAANSGAALTHAYADTDGDGLAIGLANTITAVAGTGTLTVTLRHLPPIDGTAVKTADLAQTVSDSGFAAIAGDTDVQVNFEVTVQ